jgi:general secretion pathway protein D
MPYFMDECHESLSHMLIRTLLALACVWLITSCATTTPSQVVEPTPAAAMETGTTSDSLEVQPSPAVSRPAEPIAETYADVRSDGPNIRLGTGVFVGSSPRDELLANAYVINLASYLTPYNLAELPDEGVFSTHHAYTTTFDREGKTWHRVRLGFFASRAEATTQLSQVRRYFSGAWIDRATRKEREQALAALAPPGVTAADAVTTPEGDITLNFEKASLREFLRLVFEDILGENYVVDPQVKGEVTMHTSYPVTVDAVLPILESVLQLNKAALVYDQGIYKIMPLADAESEAITPLVGKQQARRGMGYGVQIVPLKHVAASEIEKVLKPFVPAGSSLRIDAARNLLILSGPQYRIDQLLETVKIFDVDWLRGMSFGLFTLQYADAGTLVSEMQKVIGEEGQTPLAGILRLTPIERLNAVLVITHKPHYMKEVQKLIEQFDWGTEGPPGRRLYVYHLKNGKAENIAGVLQEIYGEAEAADTSGDETGIPTLPPGEGGNVFHTAETVSEPPPPVGAAGAGGTYPVTRRLTPAPRAAAGATADEGVDLEQQSPVSIIANQDSNSILVMASPEDYRAIEAAIRRLDVPPRQVLIEATIAEVTLSDSLDYGVRWFMQGSDYELAFNTPLPGGAGGDGLSLAVFNSDGDVRFFFDILETESQVKFLSTPQVMVLDNQTANIRVGDQIPVTTRSSQSTADPDAPLVTEVQFRDTGTLLSVTPRINAGGQVTLEISQEVSLPGTEPAVGGGGNVSIAQRTIDSSVVVQSGQTVVLGGLITENHNESVSGIPILMSLPWVGKLFSNTTEDVFRTELIITVSPRVVENPSAMQGVTDELRERMNEAADFEREVRNRDTLPSLTWKPGQKTN